jgi:hypothetical protein
MKKLLVCLLILTIPTISFSVLIEHWSYEKMLERADLVVIAKSLSTQEILEDSKLPDGSTWDVVGLATQLEVRAVLKGDKNLKSFTLHHYRQKTPEEVIPNGPSFVLFDPKHHQKYLLFLKKESDGRYSPVTGQVYPALFSVLKLNGVAE